MSSIPPPGVCDRKGEQHASPAATDTILYQMKNCSNVTVAWITLQNSPFWTSHYQGCTNVTIDSIHSLGDSRWPNNDACDPDSSENVVVRDSVFDTGDDGLCPKASLVNRPFRNLTAHGLWIRSKSCAIKLGSTTHADMHDFVFENITIVDSNRGLGIQQREYAACPPRTQQPLITSNSQPTAARLFVSCYSVKATCTT